MVVVLRRFLGTRAMANRPDIDKIKYLLKAPIPHLVDFNFKKPIYFTDNHYINRILLWISLKSLVVVKTSETNTRANILWSWEDFQIYKLNGILFAAHLALVKITPHVYW